MGPLPLQRITADLNLIEPLLCRYIHTIELQSEVTHHLHNYAANVRIVLTTQHQRAATRAAREARDAVQHPVTLFGSTREKNAIVVLVDLIVSEMKKNLVVLQHLT